jgi:dCMP deaminase
MNVAKAFAERSTCSRRKVGAVVVKDGHIISTGYNGAPSGDQHCVDGGCPRGKLSFDECPPFSDYNQFPCVAIHAEANAIIRAGFDRCNGGMIYTTCKPCLQCEGMIRNAGIRIAVWPGTFKSDPPNFKEYS